MSGHTPEDYRRIARQFRDRAANSLPGLAEGALELARAFEVQGRRMERTSLRDLVDLQL